MKHTKIMQNTCVLVIFVLCRFGQGSGAIHFSAVDCSDDDIHILNCDSSSSRISQCTHDDDVGLICCKYMLLSQPYKYDIVVITGVQ